MRETHNPQQIIGMDGKPIYQSEFPASVIAHWPTGPIAVCDKHAQDLVELGNFMGTHVAITNAPEGSICSNCANKSPTPKAGEE